jgi:hypothetical protein
MIHEFNKPIPVVTPEGDGYAIYVSDSGMLENDVWCVTLCKGGQLLHFNTRQLRVSQNATFGIQPPPSLAEIMSKIKL